jgi:hypothetical protein
VWAEEMSQESRHMDKTCLPASSFEANLFVSYAILAQSLVAKGVCANK